MQYLPTTRRTQFSSCDACRQSRVACDASKTGYQPGETRWNGSCSRCSLRNRRCTFEWIKKTPARQREVPRLYSGSTIVATIDSGDSIGHAVSTNRPELSSHTIEAYSAASIHQPRSASCELLTLDSVSTSTAAISSYVEYADRLLSQCSDFIFNHGIGPIFGRWAGKYGCPFVDEPTSDVCISPTKLFGELDGCMENQLDDHADEISATVARRQEKSHQIDQSLRRAMQSYAAQWLPILEQRNPTATDHYEQLIRDCWRATRRDMLKVINRISYRSVLTLYLFSETPVPIGLCEEEEQDGITGVVCIRTALLQIQQLRERLRSCHFDGSEVWARSDSVSTPITSPNLSEKYLSLESRVYWAAITWDTSSSMTLNFRSSLSSGLKGACLETSWRLAKGFLVGSFHPRTEEWRKKGFEVSDEVAQEIISAVAVCRIYMWRTIASVKEALREGVEEDSVLFSWNSLLDALEIFKTTIHPLLNNCEKQLHFLSQVSRLYWYEMVLHYYLGILMLVDALETAKRSDLLSQVTETRLEAEHECFNVLKFGLESKYALNASQAGLGSACDQLSTTAHRSEQQIITSFVAIDPYPHHVVASVRLVNKAITRKYRQCSIKYEAYSYLSSTLLRTLAELPQSSKAVRSARENLRESMDHLETSSVTSVSYPD